MTFGRAWEIFEDRRRILMANVDKILVLKGQKGKRGPLDYRRVKITWRMPQFEALIRANNFRPDLAVYPETMGIGQLRCRILIDGELRDLDEVLNGD